MNEVLRVVRLASWRLLIVDFFRTLAVTLTAALVAALIARVVERVFGLGADFAPLWPQIAMGGAAAAIVIAAMWTFFRRRRSLAVARELDERAGLRESLSTAMCVQRSQDDPWAKMVIDTARQRAATVKVGQAIPFEAPRLWPVPLATGIALALVWVALPNFDVLKITAKKVAQDEKQQEVLAVKSEAKANQDKLKELLAKAKVDLGETTDNPADNQKPEANDPDSIRRAEVKQLTGLKDKLESLKEGDKAAQAEALKQAMRQLRQPGDGPLDEFSRSLARGDFNKAQEKLDELTKAMADNSMSPEQMEQTKKQLDNLSKQLEKLGQDQQELAKKLEQAGLDKKSAAETAKKASLDPEALKKALEQMKNLSEEQKKQLMEMAKAAKECNSKCSGMGEAMAKMAEGMSQSGLQQEGLEGMEELAQELSDMEMLESDMASLDAALDEAKMQLAELGKCLGGECEGMGEGLGQWKPGASNKMGNGSGGPGKGNGPSPDAEAVDFTLEKKKAETKNAGGPIIGTRLVYGEQVKGESTAEFAEAVEAGAQSAAEAIENKQVPREYQEAVKRYFGTLGEKVKTDRPAPSTPDATTPTTPGTPTPTPAATGK